MTTRLLSRLVLRIALSLVRAIGMRVAQRISRRSVWACSASFNRVSIPAPFAVYPASGLSLDLSLERAVGQPNDYPGIFAKSQVTALVGWKRMNARSPRPRPTRNL